MWVDADDEHVLINTEVHRAKYRNVQADPRVTVTIWDRESPYRYVEVRGRVTGEVRGEQDRTPTSTDARSVTSARTTRRRSRASGWSCRSSPSASTSGACDGGNRCKSN